MSKFLKGVDLNEGKDKGYFIPNLLGEGAPSEKTEGAIGSQYMDSNTGDIYKCTAIVDGEYTWEYHGGKKEAVLYTPQNLENSQKTQARNNIGAQGKGEPLALNHSDSAVLIENLGYEDQDNTSVIKACDLLGQGMPDMYNSAVRIRNVANGTQDNDAVNKKQMEESIEQAQQNSGAILYTDQTLTEEQKTQARENIGACQIDNTVIGTDAWSSQNIVDKLCPVFEESGSVVRCDPVERYPLDVVTKIEPVQSGSGVPSPDNIRPITGHTDVKLYHSGKNLCNYRPPYQVPSNSVVVEQLENGVIVQGSAGSTPGANYNSCGWFYPVGATDRGDNLLYLQAGQRICISADYTILEEPYGAHDGAVNITLRDPNGKIESIARRVYIAPEVGKKYRISTCADMKTTGYYCFFISLNSCKVKIENIQVEIGDTATEYEPYQGNTFTMELGQTVYGGSLDWKTGVLTITHELEVFDGNNKTLDYSIFQKSDGTEAVACTATITAVTGRIFSYVCSHLRRDDASPKTYEYGTFYITGNRYFVSFIEEFADANELTAWLVEQYSNGTPFTIGYELSTPITAQLTPTEVQALSGTNCLISDTGNTTVIGKADPLPIIDNFGKRLAALEAAIVNNA